ncbi:YpdA family putative bacillithiol disulfide reductase [Aureivirga sp. CE67]|uniref:YpdA family putative bacillithiol disulfide reductase n=1 Tax=Aureivirga sp. CE67 TaxID=1788983 RepID=UPI0018CADD67|nr:YpdA family putative bacillithiol disulfide reductase [Aureivirga sp. CE67]
MYDIGIIGAGPIGLACGIEAKKNNLSHVIIDKGTLTNSIYNYPLNMTFFSTSEKLEIGNIPFISHGNKPNRFEALEYYRRVASHWELNLKLYEEVLKTHKKEEYFEIETSKNTYLCKNIIVATGFYDLPFLMNVKGEDLPKVKHYYDEPHPYFQQDIIVVGAANSAVDVALETFRKKANVTMVIRETEIGQNVKYWVKPDIENRIREGEIKAFFESKITEIRQDEVDIVTPEGKKTLKNDFVLAMTGYKPNFKLIEKMGVKFHDDSYRTPIYNQDTHETTVSNLYIAGVVCGGLKTNKWFIENSRIHAEKIIENIVNKS